MAKFLQETIRESGIKSPDKIKQSEEFKEFFRKVRSFPGPRSSVDFTSDPRGRRYPRRSGARESRPRPKRLSASRVSLRTT